MNMQEQYLDLWTFWIALDYRQIGRAAEIVHSLESGIGIKCDPIFVETY